MKTAVSLPDDLFRQAERTAKKLCISRSQLYATAIARFLEHHESESVTEQLDAVYAQAHATLDPALQREQLKLLKQSEW